MARIQLSRSAQTTVAEKQPTAVYIKRNWGDAWKLMPYLDWVQASHVVAPAVSSATLVWRYGYILHEDRSTWAVRSPMDAAGWYCQIRLLSSRGSYPIWTGRICADQTNPEGDLQEGSGSIPTGTQTLQAYGMEHELDLTPIIGSMIDDDGTLQVTSKTQSFNKRNRFGGGYQGNRSTAIGTNGSYNFSSDGETWSNYGIADYIVKNHAPRLVSADAWSFKLTGQLAALGYIIDEHNLEGLTVKQILDHLIDRRRGLGWYIAPIGTSAGEIINIVVYSCFGDAVSAGDVTIPGNTQKISNWNLGNDRRMQDVVIVRNRSERVDSVMVAGAPLKTCLSMSVGKHLEPAWTEHEETAYKTGDALNPTNAELCDIERKTDKFSRVYKVFRVKKDWDGIIMDPDGLTPRYAFPLVWPDGTIDETVPGYFWNYGKSFERRLPIAKPSDNVLADGTREPEFMEPVVFLRDDDLKYRQTDACYEDGSSIGQVRMRDNELAIEVCPSINHKLALTHFDPNTYQTGTQPEYNYETIIATLCIASDQRITVTMTRPDAPATGGRGLLLDCPTAQVWRILPYTYLGVTSGALTYYTPDLVPGNLLRDDREKMRQLCALTLAWFGEDRCTVSITSAGLLQPPALGSYLERVSDSRGSLPVKTIVTSHTWRNSQSENQMPTTAIETGYDAPDFQGLIEFPGMSDIRAVSREIRRIRSEQQEIMERIGNLPVRFSGGGGSGGTAASGDDTVHIYAIGFGDDI